MDITPGQRYLLNLIQTRLLNLLYAYHTRQHEALRGKIYRISARQNRFTKKILSGDYTKNVFLGALGLVTKEDLAKLKAKSNERRRRTTANPRFSYQAIQAKRESESRTPTTKQQQQQAQRYAKLQQEISLKANLIKERRARNEAMKQKGMEIMSEINKLEQFS